MKRLILILMMICLADLTVALYPATAAPLMSGASESFTSQPPKKRNKKIKKPVSAEKAQKNAVKAREKKNLEIAKSSKETQKRSYEMQSDDVKKRMKQNRKETKAREKASRKMERKNTKRADRKYSLVIFEDKYL